MANIINEILKRIPASAKISESCFEAANIILYTKNKEFFLNNEGIIKSIVDEFKKRIELRPDPSITLEQEKAEKVIKEIIPKDAGADEVIFDPSRSRVIIEAEKPGLAIGKQGEVLKEIKKKTLWVPVVRRTPALKSKIIENIRFVLYENSEYRRKFLDKVGHRIYDGWLREKKHEWIRLTFLGGGRQVGRSCALLQTPESRILIDCGYNPSGNDTEEAYPYFDAPEFKIDELDAVILTHAHLDHCAWVPFLYKMGFKGPTYCTAASRDIAALLLLDFIGVAFKQAKKSLFSSTDVKEFVKHTICLDYGEVSDITPDVRITLYNAGHVLGSSIIHMHIGNGLHNLIFTGDIKCIRTQLLEPAATDFPRLETAIIESTYGGKDNILKSRRESEDEFIEIIRKTIERGGKVLIPELGVGRSQETMLIVEQAVKEGRLPRIPFYVQGMIWDVTAIHTAYPDFLNKNIRKAIFHKDENPFLSDIFKRVASKKEQQDVIGGGPCVIMATSGMLTSGASVDYFRQLADNAKNTLLFVSYQGEGTLGRRIQNGEKEIVMINDEGKQEMVKVNIEIHTISALTGHAGRQELVRYINNLNPRPKKVIVNHGESSRCLDLASSLHKMYKLETVAPRNLEAVRIK